MKGKVLFEYYVGASRIRIVRSENSYLYMLSLEPEPSPELIGKIKENHEVILTSLPLKNEITENDIVEVVKDALGISNEYIPLALHLVKKELKYKVLQELLEDPYVEDITIVGSGPIWVRHKKVLELDSEADYIPTNLVIDSLEEVLELQKYIAQKAGVHISMSNPIVDAQLPEEDGGHRIHLVGPEITGRKPEITIRKRINRAISIKELITQNVLTAYAAAYLYLVLRARGSVVIAGPPSSGKTTLLRALLEGFIPRSWKVVIIEDTAEIDPPPGSNWVRYITMEKGKNVIDQFILAKAALRASANKVIVIGETRGAEAQVLAQAMNLGMGALTTFHGGSAEEVIVRLKSPPINLSEYQVAMIWCIVLMKIIDFKGKFLRIIDEIDEIVPEGDKIVLRRIFSRDSSRMKLLPENSEEIIKNSIRLNEAAKRLGIDKSSLNYMIKEIAKRWLV